jgi:hypothetical protein
MLEGHGVQVLGWSSIALAVIQRPGQGHRGVAGGELLPGHALDLHNRPVLLVEGAALAPLNPPDLD